MSRIEEITEGIAAPTARELGYEYVDCEYVREGQQWVLTIYIDKPGGVTLDDCERASRLIEERLDEADPIPGPYCLCVSSPGLTRPLKKPRDFERNMGNTIDVKLYAPFEGKKEFTGVLVDFDGEKGEFTIETGEVGMTFTLGETAKAAPHIDFN